MTSSQLGPSECLLAGVLYESKVAIKIIYKYQPPSRFVVDIFCKWVAKITTVCVAV